MRVTEEFADRSHDRSPLVVPMELLNRLQSGALACLACGDQAVLLHGSAAACAEHAHLSSLQLRTARVAAIEGEGKR